jgi:transaldolase
VASGKLAFVEYEKTFGNDGTRYKTLKDLGANRQRALWASTSTKNPAYKDTKYVEDLIGPMTVNTIPPATLKTFIDHGVAERTIDKDLESASRVFSELAALGIDLKQATQDLETEGVKAFADAFTSLLDSIQMRMVEFQK